jgi:hypothetical protein
MNGECWLIGNPHGRWPSLMEQAVSERGRWSRSGASSSTLSKLPPGRGIVVAIAADQLAALASADKQRIAERVAEGAVLYVKGGFKPGESFSMAPFANSCFSIADTNRALGWRLTDHRFLPRVIAKEAAIVEFESMTAAGTAESVEPILFMRSADSRERPVIFTVGCGAGSVIYDLTAEEIPSSASLLGALEDPATFPGAIGAVVAAGFALASAAPPKPYFNLVIDDRPANLDYLSTARLRAFMQHLNDQFFGIHVDFAWTPDQLRPSRRYIEILKEYQCGFVWHGLLHHIDHRTIRDPDSALSMGQHLVETICRRYQVRFQPVMIFPFERDTPRAVDLLRRAGFLAMAETPPLAPNDDNPANGGATADGAADRADEKLIVLKRYPVAALSRTRMLALATLGRPIIAAAHPRDVSLRRLPLPRGGDGSFAHFDQVLGFAAEKQLQPASLERIAVEALTTRSYESLPQQRVHKGGEQIGIER